MKTEIKRMVAAGLVILGALTGAQGGCAPHPSTNKASYWLKVEGFRFGKIAPPDSNFRFNVQMTITSKCYPLGAQTLDDASETTWGHQVNIAESCNDPVTIELRASRHPANVGDAIQCSIAPVVASNEATNPLVAEGKQRSVPGSPNIIVIKCTTTVNG